MLPLEQSIVLVISVFIIYTAIYVDYLRSKIKALEDDLKVMKMSNDILKEELKRTWKK